MESRKLIYNDGHFYDPATRQRVQPRCGLPPSPSPKTTGEPFECRCVTVPLEHDARLRFTKSMFANSLNEVLKNPNQFASTPN